VEELKQTKITNLRINKIFAVSMYLSSGTSGLNIKK
jgi:hypothetical protein